MNKLIKNSTEFQDVIVPEADVSISNWQNHKRETEKIADLVLKYDEDKALKIAKCGTWLTYYADDRGGKHLYSANFCKYRLCPMCQWRRSQKVMGQMFQIIAPMNETTSFIHAVFTIPNCTWDELSESIDKLFAGFSRLRKRKEFVKAFNGYFRSFEVTRNTDKASNSYNTLHPHMHVLLTANASYFTSRDYISQAKMQNIWADCVREDVQSMFMRKVGSRAGAISEVCGYSVKPNNLFEDLDEDGKVELMQTLDKAFKGRRLLSLGGDLKERHSQLHLSDPEDPNTDEPDFLPEEPERWTIYRWSGGYQETDTGKETFIDFIKWTNLKKENAMKRRKELDAVITEMRSSGIVPAPKGFVPLAESFELPPFDEE